MAQRQTARRVSKEDRAAEESIYSLTNINLEDSQPRVRVHNVQVPKQQTKVKMHADSSQIESILNPVMGIRDAQLRAGIKPTNHAKNNVAAIKEQSKMNALRKLQGDDKDPVTGRSLHRSSSGGSKSNSFGHTREAGRRTTSEDGGRNFVEENRIAAGTSSRSSRTGDTNAKAFIEKRDYGKVPQYLMERKMELAADYEARMKSKEEAAIPAGMRMLPEEERLETLGLLEANRLEVEKQLQQLPILIETPGQVRRKDELERRLQEIEEAKKIFSRSKVLVHL